MPFVLLDIPHTGVRLLTPRFSREHGANYFDDVARDRGPFANADDDTVAETLVVRTREPVGLHHRFDELRRKVFYLTMIRNPVDRLTSLYEGILANPDHVEFAAVSNQSLAEFATGPSPMATPNLQARKIAGIGSRAIEDAELALKAQKSIERHFFHVGATERFDDMVDTISTGLGLPPLTQDRTPPRSPDTAVSNVDREAIAAHHSVDTELWRSVVEGLDRAQVASGDQAPLVVLQMGKVGSRSIVDALERTTGSAALHVHATDRESLDRLVERDVQRGLPIPPHVGAGKRLLELVERGEELRVVSLVREPLDRNLSAFFQNLSLQEKLPRLFSDDDVDTYVERFSSSYPHRVPLRWFDVHVRPALGINVFARPFDHDAGYAFYQRKNISLLVMRAESSDATKRKAIERSFGIDVGDFATANVSSAKAYGNLYAQFKARVVLSDDYINSMYDSRYSRHFYTDDELDKFAQKWRSRLADAESTPTI